MMSEAALFVVDEDSDVRMSVSEMLAGYDFRIETFASIREYLNQYDTHQPGCLLMDTVLSELEQLKLTPEFNDQHASCSALIITAFRRVLLPTAFMRTAATNLIEKPFQKDNLLRRIQTAIQLDSKTRHYLSRQIEFAELLQTLTKREREVLESVVQGKTTKLIAAGLGSSYHMVRNQRSSILKKLKVNSVVDAVRMVSEYWSFECFQNIFGSMGD